ncbi:MAG: SAM-dependent methyltransferase, partial [Eubacterium sp.]
LIHDYHPFMNMLPLPGEEEFDQDKLNQVSYSYFRTTPWIENDGMCYMSNTYHSKTFTSFSHTMAEIITSLATNGFYVLALNEYDYDVGLTDVYDKQGLPLSFLLTAKKQ